MNQPPIDNQFVQPGCEQFSQPAPSDTPRVAELLKRFVRESTPTMQCHHDLSALATQLEAELIRLSAERSDRLERAIDEEPEYPGDIPDEMWEAINGNREATAEALRLTVRLTKDGIRKRISGAETIAERQSAWAETIKENNNLRATLAERDRQLAEANSELDEETNLTRRLLKGIEEKAVVRDLKDKLAASERQRKEMESSARELVAKIKLIHGDARYHSVWICAANHGTPYTGPKYDRELERLEKSLRSTPETPTA